MPLPCTWTPCGGRSHQDEDITFNRRFSYPEQGRGIHVGWNSYCPPFLQAICEPTWVFLNRHQITPSHPQTHHGQRAKLLSWCFSFFCFSIPKFYSWSEREHWHPDPTYLPSLLQKPPHHPGGQHRLLTTGDTSHPETKRVGMSALCVLGRPLWQDVESHRAPGVCLKVGAKRPKKPRTYIYLSWKSTWDPDFFWADILQSTSSLFVLNSCSLFSTYGSMEVSQANCCTSVSRGPRA